MPALKELTISLHDLNTFSKNFCGIVFSDLSIINESIIFYDSEFSLSVFSDTERLNTEIIKSLLFEQMHRFRATDRDFRCYLKQKVLQHHLILV
jgi:hypothetical protein